VKNLEEQLLKLCNELKQAQIKLDDAENMKRNLQDRSDNSLTFKEVANAQLGCIYLIKNTVNQLIFSILIKIIFYFSSKKCLFFQHHYSSLNVTRFCSRNLILILSKLKTVVVFL